MVQQPSPPHSPATEPAADEGRRGVKRKSQAVVVIHGMGEQRPMSTLRSLVDVVWNSDLSLTDPAPTKRTTDPQTGREINRSWIVPDDRAGSHELRRITTVADVNGRRTDFYEFYWADLLQGNVFAHLLAWIRGLLLRRWSTVPADARPFYLALWIVLILSVLPAAALWLMGIFGADRWIFPATVWTAFAALVGLTITTVVLPVYGDVATYVLTEPGTVGKRAAVRARGTQLLERLMEDESYDRIVVVGHSLGSIIAYDLLQILWVKYGPSHRNPRPEPEVTAALRAIDPFVSPAVVAVGQDPTLPEEQLPAFRTAQWRLYEALRTAPDKTLPWKISDFVTLGSPLTHAEFLVALDAGKWRRGVEERVYSVCPPIAESERRATIVYKDHHAHHAAVFAATRWTNVCDLGNYWSSGDPFSGRMTGNFYGGTKEMRVRLRWKLLGFRTRLMTHTHYWSADAEGEEIGPDDRPTGRDHIAVVREAIDLARRMEPRP